MFDSLQVSTVGIGKIPNQPLTYRKENQLSCVNCKSYGLKYLVRFRMLCIDNLLLVPFGPQ